MADTTNQQPMSDDQELAKVLAGVSQDADVAASQGAGMTYEATPAAPVATADATTDDSAAAASDPIVPEPVATPEPVAAPVQPSGDLDDIKLEALQELRPLVDKLNVSPEEKFDTYLLLLRSTDDKALIEPAHEAAKNISDETRRAQALLDIIKEIDFLSQPQQ